MSDEVEFVYNTRFRRQSLDAEYQSRLAAALVRDIRRQSEEEEEEIVDDGAFQNDEDDGDIDFVLGEDASDIEDEIIIEANEIMDSDENDTPYVENREESEQNFFGRDGTIWRKAEPPRVGRLPAHNIMRFRAGPKEQNAIPVEVFKKFFSPNIAFIIVTETNRYAKKVYRKWNEENPGKTTREWIDLTITELEAFIGILLAAGVSHNNMQNSVVLWQTDALPIFRAAMSHKRFRALTRYIRFDDGRTRAFRQQIDKAAPIRDIWNFFNENLAKHYDPHETVTCDEQLFPYRGQTKFTQYIPSKPAKYGIKIWWVCDAKTKYPLQGRLYTGREEEQEREVITRH